MVFSYQLYIKMLIFLGDAVTGVLSTGLVQHSTQISVLAELHHTEHTARILKEPGLRKMARSKSTI
jgi:hypothetical protein